MKVWLNGALRDDASARIDPADRGFLYGDGLFETIAVRNGNILRLETHSARLRQGCEILGLPFPTVDLAKALAETLAANQLKNAVLRLTYTRGTGPRGFLPPENIQPTLLITAAPLPPPRAPVHCIIASVTRRNEYSPLARVKSLSVLDNILARQEAQQHGTDDALLLNAAGHIAESSAANLFIVKDGRFLTPPVADGALPGVMRAQVLAATQAVEQSLTPQDLEKADEIFLTSSLGIWPVLSVNGKTVGNGTDGSALGALKRQFN